MKNKPQLDPVPVLPLIIDDDPPPLPAPIIYGETTAPRGHTYVPPPSPLTLSGSSNASSSSQQNLNATFQHSNEMQFATSSPKVVTSPPPQVYHTFCFDPRELWYKKNT